MMFDFFKRIRLKRQGYSCGRKRRESAAGGWREAMGGSAVVRWLLLGVFLVAAALVSSAFPESMMREESGGVFALLALLAAALVHLRTSLRKTWDRNGRVTLVFGALLLQTAAFLVPQLFARMDSAFGEAARLFLGPVALAPMLLTQLLGRRHGLFAAVYGSLWSGLMVPREMALPCVVLGVVTGLTAMATVRHLRKRGQLLRAALITGLASVLTAAALGVIDHPWSDAAPEQAWLIMSMEAGMLMATALVTALVAGGMLPLLESVFGITTPLSWLELADLNHPLLRRMTMEAPGTYHHSLMVANLAEAAAEAVGANGTQCRVCSYFHDIGKLVKPEYCIENITDENPHDDLAPSMSALVVMAHVKDGVDLACRHKLNREITDVIRQHHGTSLVYYFYRKALEQQEAARLAVAAGKATAEDIPEVRESSFRYPGPRPSTRESAIVSLADAVESASRSLAKPTPQRIEAMVEEIVRSRLKDGQLDECALTMNDLHAVRESFVKTLRTSLHRRIPYPDEKPEEGKGRTRTGREAEKPATSVSGTTPPPSNVIPMPVTPPVAAPPAQEPGERAV